MNANRRSFLSIGELLTVAAVIVALAASQRADADSYSPEYLFTLQFGEADDQVAVWVPPNRDEPEGVPAGPTGLAVGPDGSIYIADRVNHCVKRFNEQGELLMRTEGSLDNIQHLAVDGAGDVYVLGGAAIGTLWKFSSDGQLLRRTALGAAIPAEVRSRFPGCFNDITIGPEDTLCVGISTETSAVALFDRDGDFLAAYEGYACTPTGKIVSLRRVPQEKLTSLAAEVFLSDLDGQPLASYVADSRAGDPGMFAGADYGFSGRLFDSQDCMYAITHAASPYKVALSPDLTIATDVIVTRHDPSGRPLAYLRFPSFPFYTGSEMTVDPAGNVYQLWYDATSVDVIRYRLDASSPEVQSLRVLAAMSREGTSYVPLTPVAEHAGMSLQWDPAAKRAILSPRSSGDGARSITLSARDPGVLLYEGHLWVSIPVMRETVGAILKTDAKERIAYLVGHAEREVPRVPE